VKISTDQRDHTEARIRAATDRLLRGDLTPGGKCDIRTLATEAGVTRSSLYTTYAHLKAEFEQRRQRLRSRGVEVDPRQAQIARLTTEISALRRRLIDRETANAVLADFRTTALSRLAAQHDEILHLRTQIARYDNVRPLHSVPPSTRRHDGAN
jgi:hypothetical protein